jgi:hypothetical protein
MDILTIDFETYYDREFSLSKITTEEYVRSKQFETIGVALTHWVNAGQTSRTKSWPVMPLTALMTWT